MIDYIQGNRFKSLAKWFYAPARLFTGHPYRDAVNNILPTDYRYLANTLDWSQLNDGDIVYTHTFYADQLFERLNKKVTVISHNSDTPADLAPPPGVVWYTTNVNVVNENVFSIPIGIENDFWLKDKRKIMENKFSKSKKYKNLIYVSHNIKTNPAKRQKAYDVFKGVDYATVEMGANGQGFDNYIYNVYNHPFVVAPEGNGIDTHRVWECLYMRTVPVVIRNINNSFYTDLPILFIDDWDEINEKFLHDSFMEMSRKEWNMDKLNFEWWRKKITGN
jgi:hypothetical protein